MENLRLSMRFLAAVSLVVGLCAWAGETLAQGSAATDQAALYHATNGSSWTDNTNWLTTAPLSEWFGVRTDGNGRVTALDLDGNALSGPLLAAVGNLAFLQRLRLGSRWDSTSRQWIDNALSGPIPSELEGRANYRRWPGSCP